MQLTDDGPSQSSEVYRPDLASRESEQKFQWNRCPPICPQHPSHFCGTHKMKHLTSSKRLINLCCISHEGKNE